MLIFCYILSILGISMLFNINAIVCKRQFINQYLKADDCHKLMIHSKIALQCKYLVYNKI